MTLNGTFKSNKGKRPIDYEYIDSTFKIDKTKLFKYDNNLEKHIYGSYGDAQGFGIVKGLLSYKHDLIDRGIIAINFKIESNPTKAKTILDFKKDGFTKFAVKRNSSGKLSFMINSATKTTNLDIPTDRWNRLLICFSPTGIITYLNDISNVVSVLDTTSGGGSSVAVDLFDTKLYMCFQTLLLTMLIYLYLRSKI